MRNRFKRIAALTLTLVIVFPLAVIAAKWQWTRHIERDALNTKLEYAYSKDPIDVSSVSDLESRDDSEYLSVKMRGNVASKITWWRKQSLDGIPGYIALVEYKINDEKIVLALGWAQQPVFMQNIQLNNIVARIRNIHVFSKDPSDLPINQTNSPSTIIKDRDLIYLELTSPNIKGLEKLPLPEITAGPHLGYVGQWILIAIFAIAVYVVALRNLPED